MQNIGSFRSWFSESFVTNNFDIYYRGSKGTALNRGGVYLTTNKDNAKSYGNVAEFKLKPGLKLLDCNDPKEITEVINKSTSPNYKPSPSDLNSDGRFRDTDDLQNFFASLGYESDGYDAMGGDWRRTIKKMGYDGAIRTWDFNKTTNVIVFNPSNVIRLDGLKTSLAFYNLPKHMHGMKSWNS